MTAEQMPQVPAKTLLTRNKSTAWFGCEYNMNLYRGCTHGCIYCDSRSDCYHIEQFDTVAVKHNALEILRDNLARKVKTGVVATGAMSDPYNPYEKELELTRHALELISAYGFGVAIATKSDLIVRDRDILAEISENNPVLCKITVTTLDDSIAAQIEPGAASSSQRLAAVEALSEAGLFTGVLMMPVLPYITDDPAAIADLVKAAAKRGARFIYPSFGLTMRSGQREYCLQQLDSIYPDKQFGHKYRQKYGSRYYCASPNSKKCWDVFTAQCKEHGLLYEMRDIVAAYRQGYSHDQLSFF